MVECNRGCGAMDLHWKVVNGKYKLFSFNDLLHMCHEKQDLEAMAKAEALKDPAKLFTITSTANGIAITGDDKHTAVYLPKVAVPEMIKALVDFI